MVFFFFSFLIVEYFLYKIYKKKIIKKLYKFFIYTLLVSFIGARIGHIIFYDFFYFKNHLIEIFFPIKKKYDLITKYEFSEYRGLSSHGGMIGMIFFTFFYTKKIIKKPFLWFCDIICIPICIGSSFIRIGNFFNSEILGKYSSLPWSVKFMNSDLCYKERIISRHPTQLYEFLIQIYIFILIKYIYFKTKKKKNIGYIFGIFSFLLWLGRFIIEFFKTTQKNEFIIFFGLNTGQILSIPFIILGIICIINSYLEQVIF